MNHNYIIAGAVFWQGPARRFGAPGGGGTSFAIFPGAHGGVRGAAHRQPDLAPAHPRGVRGHPPGEQAPMALSASGPPRFRGLAGWPGTSGRAPSPTPGISEQYEPSTSYPPPEGGNGLRRLRGAAWEEMRQSIADRAPGSSTPLPGGRLTRNNGPRKITPRGPPRGRADPLGWEAVIHHFKLVTQGYGRAPGGRVRSRWSSPRGELSAYVRVVFQTARRLGPLPGPTIPPNPLLRQNLPEPGRRMMAPNTVVAEHGGGHRLESTQSWAGWTGGALGPVRSARLPPSQ